MINIYIFYILKGETLLITHLKKSKSAAAYFPCGQVPTQRAQEPLFSSSLLFPFSSFPRATIPHPSVGSGLWWLQRKWAMCCQCAQIGHANHAHTITGYVRVKKVVAVQQQPTSPLLNLKTWRCSKIFGKLQLSPYFVYMQYIRTKVKGSAS